MKLTGLCLLALAVVATNCKSERYPKIEVGKSYVSEYKAYTVSGFPLVDNQRTGIAIWSKVLTHCESENKWIVQLQDPVIRQINLESNATLPVDGVPRFEFALYNEREFQRLPENVQDVLTKYIEKIVQVTVVDGKITEVLADRDEPEWVLSLKAGVFAHFQIPRVAETTKTIVEDTLVGSECDVEYDLVRPLDNNDRTILVTKKYSLESCEAPIIRDDLFRLANEPRKDSERSNLKTSFVTSLNVTDAEKPFILELVSEARYTLSMFSPNHGEATTYTRQELKFLNETDQKPSLSQNNLVTRNLISQKSNSRSVSIIDNSTSQMSEEKIMDLIKLLLSEIIQETELSPKPTFDTAVSEKFTLAIKLMNILNETTSFKQIVDLATKDQNTEMRNLVVMALANCHSPALYNSLTSLEPKLTQGELAGIVTGLGVNGYPTSDSLHQLKKLYGSSKHDTLKEQTLLAIGSQVHQMCRPHRVYGKEPIEFDPACTSALKTEFLNFYRQEYAKGNETRRLIVLKAIGNSGLEMVDILEQIIMNNSTAMELRVNAIYAMRRNHDLHSAVDTLLPVYRDWKQAIELRIAAFNTLIEIAPTSKMLVSLVSHLNEEPIMQLGNYVYTYLESLIQIPTLFAPTKNLTMAAQTLLPTVQRFESSVWYSQNRQFFTEQLGVRVHRHLEASVVTTTEQAMPRSFLLRMSRDFCGFFLNALELGFRIEGADTYIEEIANKWFSNDMLDHYSIHSRQYVRDLNKIYQILKEDDIKVRSVEETKGHIFFRAMGNELGLFRFDEKTLGDLTSDLVGKLINLGENRYFNIFSQFPTELRTQSPMGVTIFSDISYTNAVSIHTDDSDITAEDLIWSKNITFKNTLRTRVMYGINLGPMQIALGSCEHLKIVLPHTWEVKFDLESGKVGVEVYWNVKDPLYTSREPENYHLIQASRHPVSYFLSIDLEKKEIDLKVEKVRLHPLLTISERKYSFDFVGHNLTSTQQADKFTRILPISPFDGRHIVTLSFYDLTAKPYGLKFDLDTNYSEDIEELRVSLNVTLNPRVEESSKRLDMGLSTRLEQVQNKAPSTHIVLEATPRWLSNGTYRAFLRTQKTSGRQASTLSWLEAGEDITLERLFTLQYGWNIVFEEASQDLVLVYRNGKSDLQKEFERQDLYMEGSDCNKCESLKREQNAWSNIFCERCMLKRQTASQQEYKIFLSKEQQIGKQVLDTIFRWLQHGTQRYLSSLESHRQDNVTMKLIEENSQLLKKYMSELPEEGILAFRRQEDANPSYTELNVTTDIGDRHLRYLNVPMIPSQRRLDNLPLDRLTDVYSQRMAFGTRGFCHIDSLNLIKTMDGVIYSVTDSDNCERILARDCSEESSFQISVASTQESPRVIYVKMGSRTVQIVPENDGYKITVDSQELPMSRKTVNEYTYEYFGSEDDSITGVVTDIRSPGQKTTKSLTIHLYDIYTDIVMVQNYVRVNVPFWYKNKMCGLCGDFNTEQMAEFKLPDQSVAKDMTSFMAAYSSEKCENFL